MPDSTVGLGLGEWIARVQEAVERALEEAIPSARTTPCRLHEAMRYAVLEGGKRVRPLLVFAAGEVSGAARPALVHAALAVEMIHAYSLVHDDLPCMDDDVLRRGKPTVHVAFDEATALLVGDALQSLAFETLARGAIPAAGVVAMVAELAQASGSRGMAGGQAIDLASVGTVLSAQELEQMHRLKTGALLGASVTLGALAAGVPDQGVQENLERYARAIGLAFQVVDDILDVETDSVTLGKTAGKDAMQNKPTYVSILGLEASKSLAARLRAEAHSALAPIGARAKRLGELADFIVLRKH
ncbi:MAG: polyprenyl synthetase family protein [Burkholderiaceae bacterium]|jgi:farnesyl diphosphate synthase